MRTLLILLFTLFPLTAFAQESVWIYETKQDEMTDEVSTIAAILSPDNTHAIGLQKDDKGIIFGIRIMITGPILKTCLACPIKIRFDDDPALEVFAFVGDDSKTFIILPPKTTTHHTLKSPIIQRLLKAKTLKVAVPLYGDSKQVVTFTVAGLDLNRLVNQKP